jgi:hypothetical protein
MPMTAAFAALQYFRVLILSGMNWGRSEGLVQEMELGEVNADAFRVPSYISVCLTWCWDGGRRGERRGRRGKRRWQGQGKEEQV